MTAWIRLIAYPESEGYLRELYDRVKGPQGQIDNVMKAHKPFKLDGRMGKLLQNLPKAASTTEYVGKLL